MGSNKQAGDADLKTTSSVFDVSEEKPPFGSRYSREIILYFAYLPLHTQGSSQLNRMSGAKMHGIMFLFPRMKPTELLLLSTGSEPNLSQSKIIISITKNRRNIGISILLT